MSLLVVSPVLYEIGSIQAEVEELNYLLHCHFHGWLGCHLLVVSL